MLAKKGTTTPTSPATARRSTRPCAADGSTDSSRESTRRRTGSGSRRGVGAASGRRGTSVFVARLIEEGRMRPRGFAEIDSRQGRRPLGCGLRRAGDHPDARRSRRCACRNPKRASYVRHSQRPEPLCGPAPRVHRAHSADPTEQDRPIGRDARTRRNATPPVATPRQPSEMNRVCVDPPIQRRPGDSQGFRGLDPVPVEPSERLDNRVALSRFESRYRAFGGRGMDIGRQIRLGDHSGRVSCTGPLQGGDQIADITGPGVFLERVKHSVAELQVAIR